MALCIDTDHGVYDVLPAREGDDAPDAATHTVFCEDGAIAGYVAEDGTGWDAGGTPWPAPFGTLEAAAAEVSESDRDAVLASRPYPRTV